MGSIQTKREGEKRKKDQGKYKGHAPLFADKMLLWTLKVIFQVPLFFMFYVLFINDININDELLEIITELVYIFFFLILSDSIAYLIAYSLDKYLIHKWGYLMNPNKKKHKAMWVTEYTLYISFRTISYAFGIIWMISGYLFVYLDYPLSNYSFIFAWIIVSFGSKLAATFISYIKLA